MESAPSIESQAVPSRVPKRRSSIGFTNSSPSAKSSLKPLLEDGLLGASSQPNTRVKMSSRPTTTESMDSRELNKQSRAAQRRQKSFGSDLIAQETGSWSADKESILFGPYNHLYGIPGKDIRSQLIAAFNAWLKVPKESLDIITTVVGMLHTASLLVDDVEDSSLLRRGVPVAHSIFGTAQTINSANYVYFCALQELQKLNNPLAITIYTEELLNLHRGQGMDLYWRDTLTCPTEDDYLEMVNNKTGGLFRLAVKLMQAESKSMKNCVPLVNTIGLLFQILDDYKNLSSTTYTVNKGLAEDLTEGKFSFPVIHAIRSDPGSEADRVLTNILAQKTTDLEVKKYAIGYLERVGSFAYTRKVLQELTGRAIALVGEMEEGGAEGEVGLGTGIRLILEKLNVGEERQIFPKKASPDSAS